eukprot:4597572-Alexandrium_andersonii.AAC.1
MPWAQPWAWGAQEQGQLVKRQLAWLPHIGVADRDTTTQPRAEPVHGEPPLSLPLRDSTTGRKG